jgi:hypothetical protein
MKKRMIDASLYLCLIAVLVLAIVPARVFATDTSFYSSNDILFYDPNDTSAICATSVMDVSSYAKGHDSGSWASGISAPYTLEQFAIETLKDLAAKEGVSSSSTVTEEHVIAMVAFMFGEGGDIMNGDIFYPLNTGINAPDLLDGPNSVDGVQSFKSFDAGVEATARTMVGQYQTRLAYILTQPTSTAQQFMYTLTYYSNYKDNLEWAAESIKNPDKYYKDRLDLVQAVRSQYSDHAGLVLGTKDHEQTLKETNKSVLVYNPTADVATSNTDTSNTGCPSDVTNKIIQTAISLAWPDAHVPAMDPTPAYASAIQTYDPAGLVSYNGADCGAFVATVMHMSGVDTNYPGLGTSTQYDYAKSNTKYTVLGPIQKTSEFQAGDIAITPSGHTYIYIGAQTNGYNIASASQGTRMPNLGNAYTTDDAGNNFYIIRINQ